MSIPSIDLGSAESAQPPPREDAPDLARYSLQQLHRDSEFELFRGSLSGPGDAGAPSILVRTPTAEHPALASLRKMQEEYSLRSELDPAYVVRPLALTQAGGQPMLVLEDPGGTPLDLLLDGPMEIARFLRLAIRIVAALGHVHSHRIVHKDVKPANILVNRACDRALLMGFGIASRVPRERQSLQPPEFVAGSLAYMAPEQTGRMNRSIDSRSDFYALGVTLYEMLTGSLPFTATDPMEWVHCHIARQPVPPSERLKDVPGPVSAIVMKLLAKMAEERYQTAAGLQSDLRRCLTAWETEQRIDEFPLGEHDTPDRLLVPEKLYGREAEIAVLLAAFERVIKGGTPELVLVAGYSGIGKSSVVNELHKVLVPPRGLFASGKFDQYKRDIPYSTLAQAFQNLIRRLLAKSEGDLATWRRALLEALGPNGRLMIDLVPELRLIIGDQPPVPDLPPQDGRRRFHLVFRRFIGVFARLEHPLALFLDDLQWLDEATLDLLEDLLTPAGVQHLMLIGAYRDNEVTAAHPLMRKLEAIRSTGANVRDITLAPLAGEDVRQFVSDALRCEPERAAPLAKLVHEKTGGNPFFVVQFLQSLAEDGWLAFDHEKKRWCWDLNRILAKRYRDNVVDLMVGRLNRLPLNTQKALQHLACLGHVAPVRMLCIALGKSPEEVGADLWDAVRLELVEHSEGSYKFVHDRIQEAAYSLIPKELRDEAHLRIGRQLAAQIPSEKREQVIFDIVNQYNRGVALITSRDEREQLAELNLVAGKRAKASTAYASALKYLVAGAVLLPGDSWERRHELIFALELQRAECEFLTSALTVSEERLKLLSAHAANTLERARITRLRLNVYTTLDQSERAVEVCLDYLAHLGVEWLPHPTREQALGEYERIWSLLKGRNIEDLIGLPLMSDPALLGTLDVLTEVVTPALFTDENLLSLVICRMVNLSLEHGNSDGSCFAYVWLGMIAGRHFDNYEAGFQFGRLGYELVERQGLRRYQARTYMSFGNLVMPWTRHVRTGRDLVRRAFDAANKASDLTFAAYSRNNLNTNLLAAGDPLAEAQREAQQGLDFAQNARFGLVIDIITAQLGLIRTLRGLTPTFGCFDDEQFDERRFESHLASQPALALPECWYWIRKLQARVLAGDYRHAIEASLKAQRLLWTSPSFFETAEFEFYSGLARAAVCDGTVHEQYRQDFAALTAHRRKLEVWAANCPENFENRAALLGAEVARIEGREVDAMRLYEQAIRSARASGFLHNEALANELAARFYAARGFEQIAHLYLRNSRQGYLRWGADGKVRQLDETYPDLQERTERVPTASGTIGAPVEHLDLATVLKVSQAVSGEIVLEKLVETLLRTAIEHAGAQRGVLILQRGSELLVQAEAKTRGSSVTVRLHETPVPLLELPESIVRYAARTQDTVILDDASARNPFSTDEYIREHRPRSVLCLPLVKQGVLVAVLYLENNLGPNFFAPGRIAVLKVLASQAAISLDNSRLYRELTESEAKFRRLVDSNIVGISIWNLDGRVIEANEAFLRIVGYERDDLISGRIRWTDFAPSRTSDRDRQELVSLVQSGESLPPFEWEFIRKDGSRVPVVTGAAILEGGSQGIGFLLDVTARKQVEQALRQSEAYLAEAQRLTHTGSWAYNYVREEYTYCSDEQFRIYGLEPGRGRLPKLEETVSLYHPEDRERMLDLVEQIVREKRAYTADYRILLPDGRVRYVDSIGHPILDERGELLEHIGTMVDVTERRRVEQRLLAQHAITRLLSEASSLDEVVPKILRAVCETLGWHVGVFWRVDKIAGVLRCGELWRRPSLGIPQFESATRVHTFPSGRGLAGKVWATATPSYISDVVRDPDCDRAEVAGREGLHAALAFPIVLGSDVLGVFELISRDVWQCDEDLPDMMASIGRQVGQFTERAAALDELKLRVNMLQQMPGGAWSATPDGNSEIVNSLWFEYTGQTPEYVKSHPEAWMSCVHPEDRERVSRTYWEGIRSGRGFTMEARYLRASDRTYRWHLERAVAVRDPEGNILRFVGTTTDVQALKKSDAYFRETQQLAHAGSWGYDQRTGRTTHYSDEAFRLFGLDPGRGYVPQLAETLQLIHPEERERVIGELAQFQRDVTDYAQDSRIVLHDGTVRHLRSIGHPVVGADGELLEYVGTVMDVTDRRRAEKRLLMETRVTRVLSEASSVDDALREILQIVCESQEWHLSALWRVDGQANMLRCAELWCAPGVAAAEFEVATRGSAFVPGGGLPGRVWARGEPICIRDVSQDPEFPRAKVAAHAGFRGAIAFPILLGTEVLGVIECFTRDLWQPDSDLIAMVSTMGGQIGQFLKRITADEELRLRVGMLQSIPVAAWSVTPDGTPDIVNQLWFEYTGQTPEYVNSHPEAWLACVHPEDRERASRIYWEGIRSGRGFTMEARFLRASDGTYRWHLNRAVAVHDPEGNVLRVVGTSTDVHDFRQVQEELRNTQAEFARITRIVTMGELTASIAHEVNQPLGAIVTSAASCARWLAAKPPQMAKARRALERIVNDGRRAGAIIQRIRTLMTRQPPRRDWLDVNETIVEVVALTQYELRRNDIVLETRLSEGLPRVSGDKVQCQQVLLNLIVNAIEAMSEISQRRRELTIVSATDGPDAVRVEVRDTGTGLEPERAAQLFEPFYTTKAEGLGIGLSISRSIVEAHGGRLTAGVNTPHGAVFCIWLLVEEPMP